VYGDYYSGEILAWDVTTHSLLADTTTNISSFGEDQHGELYVVALGGGEGTVAVAAPSGCAWTAVSNATWITITGGASGAGPKNRNRLITIAGLNFAVKPSK